MVCPKCGGVHVSVQTFQEDQGAVTSSKTKTAYREKGHGILWWLLIGWWWWLVDLISWLLFFFPRLILRLFAAPFKRKKYRGKSTTVSTTINQIEYRTVCTCQACGHTWRAK